MENTLALVTTTQQSTKFKMIVISWVHTTTNERYIEISATNTNLGQLLVRITSPNTTDVQRRQGGEKAKVLDIAELLLSRRTASSEGGSRLPAEGKSES